MANLVHTNLHQNIRQPYAIRPVLSLDTLVEMDLQLQEFQMVGPTVLVRVSSEMYVMEALCFHQTKPITFGTTE